MHLVFDGVTITHQKHSGAKWKGAKHFHQVAPAEIRQSDIDEIQIGGQIMPLAERGAAGGQETGLSLVRRDPLDQPIVVDWPGIHDKDLRRAAVPDVLGCREHEDAPDEKNHREVMHVACQFDASVESGLLSCCDPER
jgi:hypothetical protein